MVDFDMVAIAFVLMGHLGYDPVAGGIDRIAGRAGEVHARMPFGIAQQGIGAVAEGTGHAVGGGVRGHGRNGRNMRGPVAGAPRKVQDVVEGTGLDIGHPAQPVQPRRHLIQGAAFLQVLVAVLPADAFPDGEGNLVQAIDAPVDAVVADGELAEQFLAPVHPCVHPLQARRPKGILAFQQGGFRKVEFQHGHIEPQI